MKSLLSKYIKLIPEKRLYGLNIPIIGLTGGMATGKSTVAALIAKAGIPIIDADQLVKSIYARKETQEFIHANYPEIWSDGSIDFVKLREQFFKSPQIKKEIEGHIYSRLESAFLVQFNKLDSPSFIVYDVPLLFEKGLESKLDLTVLVYASRPTQVERIMKRDGHTEIMANTILDHQWDIERKKDKADFIINNYAGLNELTEEVEIFLRQVIN